MEPRRFPGTLYGRTHSRQEVAGLILSESTYAPNCRIGRHSHEAPLFYFVLRGCCHEDASGRTQAHGPATLVFLPAGEPHATHWPGSDGLCFHMEFTASWANRLAAAGLPRGVSAPGGLPRWLTTRLHAEFRCSDALSPLSIEGLTLELVAEIARRTQPAEAGPPRWLRAVRDRLHDEFASAFSLEDLARTADVHPAHLARQFRREYGCTAGDYMRRLRVEYACRLLSSGNMPLGEVALRVGFADQSHFTKTFRRFIGQTPAQFCAAHQSQTKHITLVQDK